ncbi:type I restriction-modification system subunit M [Leptonema illini]|uniref:site-specific DNA-methyltransferase (adenine-specific) n=1 Tax=Leptonema illini DSM 21528 TaxID=929563 RepID=H2CK09_9LEPT|nr:class I SAM-dependent DNA methyltransferase [Leptonema illini]EHQ06098.1 N-6 DNA methylase [Leptonema illini DSM 21528]
MNAAELKKLEDDLWKAADDLRANSDLKSSEYVTPVLGIIFLRFADNIYTRHEKAILSEFEKGSGRRASKPIDEIAIAKCGFYLPDNARYDYLLNLPDEEDIAAALKEAMKSIEEFKPELEGVLPQEEYFRLVRRPEQREIPKRLLQTFADIPRDTDADLFGQIYEYFLGKFALAEGQSGGEFFTPRSVVQLMVEILEPVGGTVFDPACGSGGMFVQSGRYIERHAGNKDDLFVSGMEKTLETVKLARMNLAVNGIRGDVRQANSYYEDPFQSFEKFDYVLANPPFNVDDVALARVKADRRFNTYGVPQNKTKSKENKTVPNANYLWINLFATSLVKGKSPKGRAGLVMANSASDARHSEADIRKTLIEKNLIYAMVTLPSNMFYTVTLPATLWFFDKAKKDERILFVDARNVFTQIDRAHREFSKEQIQNLACISRLYRGNRESFVQLIHAYFADGNAGLLQHESGIQEVARRVQEFLKAEGEKDVPDFSGIVKEVKSLLKKYSDYEKIVKLKDVEKTNDAQRKLAGGYRPFFESLHVLLKDVDGRVRRIEKKGKDAKSHKTLKSSLELLHSEIRSTEYFFTHIAWLQERFPDAAYTDVTGLCKAATQAEIAEQDYSLNPGRYVGVVIEEDGKTEEEFLSDLSSMHDEFSALSKEAARLEKVIGKNMAAILGEA